MSETRGAEFRVGAEYVAMLQPFVCREEYRYYLLGVHVSAHPKKGVLCAATDGNILGVFWDEYGECTVPGTVRLSKSTLSTCKKIKGENMPRQLVVSGDTASVYSGYDADRKEGILLAAQDHAILDGTFPDYKKIVPTLPNHAEVATFNSRLLKSFESIKGYNGESPHLRIHANGAEPALVLTQRHDFIGVIMPMRGDHVMPEFLQAA